MGKILMSDRKTEVSKNRERLRFISFAAIMIAVNIVLSRFLSINTGVFRISLGVLPIQIAGYILGPVWGFGVGITADLIGYLINSAGGPMNIGITLITGLRALIAGLVVKLNKNRLNVASVIITNILNVIIASILLMSLVLSIMGGQAMNELIEIRAINASIQGLVILGVEVLLIPLLALSRKYLPGDVEISMMKRKNIF